MRQLSFVFEPMGFNHTLRVIAAHFIEPAIMTVLSLYLKFYRRLRDLKYRRDSGREFQYWRANREQLLKPAEQGYRLKIEDLGLSEENLERLKKQVRQQPNEVIIADVDQDGFLLSYFGPIKHKPTVPKEQFLIRKRFGVSLVAINGYVGVKKNYRKQKLRFLNELRALYHLASAGCNVPAILDVDFDNLILVFSYIPGAVLSQELAKKGAVLYERDVRKTDYADLSRKERRPIRIQEAKKVLYEVIDSEFTERIFAELSKIHAAGVIGNDIKYGNIITEQYSGQPFWIDFEHAPYYPNLGQRASQLLRDQDIEEFNLFFDTEKLTYRELKAKISRKDIPAFDQWISPVYFGSGLSVGSLWDVQAGYGRWHYFLKHHLPPLAGKRVLILGANNGFEAVQMLRLGAQEVVGLETDGHQITQANFVKAAFEWADNTQYPYQCFQASLADLPAMNLGRFDLVAALSAGCNLAYGTKAILLRYLSKITDTSIWQLDRGPATADEQMSINHAVQALQDNGFPQTQVIAPNRFSGILIKAGKNGEQF